MSMRLHRTITLLALLAWAASTWASHANKDAKCRSLLASAKSVDVETDHDLADRRHREAFDACAAASLPLRAEAHLRHGLHLTARQQDSEARQVFESGIVAIEAEAGIDSALLIPLLDQLGSELFASGHSDDALKLHERALAIREKAHGAKSAETAVGLMILGADFLALEQPAKAEGFFRRAWSVAAVAGCGDGCPRATPLKMLQDALRAQPGREADAAALQQQIDRELDRETSRH